MKDLYNFLSFWCDYIASLFNDLAIWFDKLARNKPGDEHETGYNKDLPWFVKDQGPPPRRR